MEDDLLEIGKIVKTYGLDGKLKVILYGASSEVFTSAPYFILKKDGKKLKLKISGFIQRRKQFILRFQDIDSIDTAESLVGSKILVYRENLAPLPTGEYYWCDLIGLCVETEDGNVLGKVIRIFPTGSNDVYVVKTKKGEILIPATYEVVKLINVRERKMVIRPMDGLIDNDYL